MSLTHNCNTFMHSFINLCLMFKIKNFEIKQPLEKNYYHCRTCHSVRSHKSRQRKLACSSIYVLTMAIYSWYIFCCYVTHFTVAYFCILLGVAIAIIRIIIFSNEEPYCGCHCQQVIHLWLTRASFHFLCSRRSHFTVNSWSMEDHSHRK